MWITPDDANVEYLLDVFPSIDADSSVWYACAKFMEHLHWHKLRFITLGPKSGAFLGDRPSKAQCLEDLSTKEASEIFERLGDTMTRAHCLIDLASSLCSDERLDVAEEAVSRAAGLLPEKGDQLRVTAFLVLYTIPEARQKAVSHFEVTLGIASSLNWRNTSFRVLFALAELLLDEGRFNDAYAHVECIKSHAGNDLYLLVRAS